jgi:hypothetical protein
MQNILQNSGKLGKQKTTCKVQWLANLLETGVLRKTGVNLLMQNHWAASSVSQTLEFF